MMELLNFVNSYDGVLKLFLLSRMRRKEITKKEYICIVNCCENNEIPLGWIEECKQEERKYSKKAIKTTKNNSSLCNSSAFKL